MNYDVAALGELLIDFTSGGVSGQGNPLYEANPGGAPCNVLAMLARLGKKTLFLGKVGDDIFGRQLRDVIREAGIGDEGLRFDKGANTTLAIVYNHPDGDREFSFFRSPGADTRLSAAELDEEALASCRVFHFGSLSLTHEPARTATSEAVRLAKSGGGLVSFDPNLRPSLWESLDAAKEQIRWGCSQCDILKIADNELEFMTGTAGIEAGAAALRAEFPNVRILFVTRGKDGADCFYRNLHVSRPTYLGVKTVDTTGAGDTFCGCCLAGILDRGLDGFDESSLAELLAFANAASSLVTTKKGAIRAMPSREDALGLMNEGHA